MIPWERFKTPQDAYTWVKNATWVLLLVQQFKTGDWLVLKINPDCMGWHQEAMCSHGFIITTHEVQEALKAVRARGFGETRKRRG